MLQRLTSIGLLKDIWRYKVLPQLDATSACMLAHAVGVGRAATPLMLVWAYKMKWTNVIKYLRNASVGLQYEHACAVYYGVNTDTKPRGWVSDAVLTMRTGHDYGLGGHESTKLLAFGGFSTNDNEMAQAAHAAMGRIHKLTGNTSWMLECALLFNRPDTVKHLLHNITHPIKSKMYILAHNRVNLIKILGAAGVKPHKYAYINAYGTPAYDELCTIEPLDPDRYQMLRDVWAGLDVPINDWTYAAALVFGRTDLIEKHLNEGRYVRYKPYYLHVAPNMMLSVIPSDIMASSMISCGRVDIFDRMPISPNQFMNAVAAEHMHPHVLEWMFAYGKFDVMVFI